MLKSDEIKETPVAQISPSAKAAVPSMA
jgi:hypothetical protein